MKGKLGVVNYHKFIYLLLLRKSVGARVAARSEIERKRTFVGDLKAPLFCCIMVVVWIRNLRNNLLLVSKYAERVGGLALRRG